MANENPRRLKGLLEQAATDHGFELVLLEVAGSRANSVVRVYLDHPDGITIEHIALSNKWIKEILDPLPEYKDGYNLEVSSPGIERPLVKLADFVRYTGSDARVSTSHEIDGHKHFTGTITAAEGDEIVLDVEGTTVRIPFGDVKRARLHVQFDFSKEGTADDGI
ncbi:MAG TPA: ribosome maturation factor RimP [Coriobacteriia bacterium]